MKNIVLKYGLIAAAILAVLMSANLALYFSGSENSEVLGYASMVLAYIAVFFGIRSYRENVGNGAVSFGRAFKVGILITLIVCAVYVIGWEIAFWNFFPDFGDKYAAKVIEKMQASGASAAEIATQQQEMAKFAKLYKNPFFNAGMTFLEVFPAGLIMTLIASAILRKKPASREPSSTAAAASLLLPPA